MIKENLGIRKSDVINRRMFIIGLAKVIIFTGIVVRLFSLQINENKKYLTLSDKNRIREWKLAPVRGEITDYFGNVIAGNFEAYQLHIIPEQVEDFRYVIYRLKDLLELSDKEFQKIVKKKTEELNSLYVDQLEVSEEIQNFISSKITTNVRELVGAVNRIISFSRIYNKRPNISEIKIILKDLLNYSENKVTVELIQSLVCKFFKISKTEMLSSRRSRYLVRPRQTAIYLTKLLTTKSLPEIGRDFSNRDHTTVIHSIKTIEKLKKNDNELCNSIDTLKNQILFNNQNNEI